MSIKDWNPLCFNTTLWPHATNFANLWPHVTALWFCDNQTTKDLKPWQPQLPTTLRSSKSCYSAWIMVWMSWALNQRYSAQQTYQFSKTHTLWVCGEEAPQTTLAQKKQQDEKRGRHEQQEGLWLYALKVKRFEMWREMALKCMVICPNIFLVVLLSTSWSAICWIGVFSNWFCKQHQINAATIQRCLSKPNCTRSPTQSAFFAQLLLSDDQHPLARQKGHSVQCTQCCKRLI